MKVLFNNPDGSSLGNQNGTFQFENAKFYPRVGDELSLMDDEQEDLNVVGKVMRVLIRSTCPFSDPEMHITVEAPRKPW